MSEPETLPTGLHPETALLPWYVNGTLKNQEQQQVALHLETCSDCRKELDELTRIRAVLSDVYATETVPSASVARSVLARVAQEESVRRATVPDAPGLSGLDAWIRSLFLSRGVPTLAALILLVQFGLLLWVTMPSTQQEQVTTRSLGSPAVKFAVMFQEQATEPLIRQLLSGMHGRIIDGPTPEGVFVIEVLAGDAAIAQTKLESLRGRSELVRSAERLTP